MVVGVVHFVHVQSKIIIGFHITLILLIIIKCFMIVSSYKIQFFFFRIFDFERPASRRIKFRPTQRFC